METRAVSILSLFPITASFSQAKTKFKKISREEMKWKVQWITVSNSDIKNHTDQWRNTRNKYRYISKLLEAMK